MSREENFVKNLNYLKKNKGFTVPFIAIETGVNLRTMEKYFSGASFPKKHFDAIFTYLKSAYNVSESEMFAAPNKNIGKIGSGTTSSEQVREIAEQAVKAVLKNKAKEGVPIETQKPTLREDATRQELINYITTSLPLLNANHLSALGRRVMRFLGDSKVKKSIDS